MLQRPRRRPLALLTMLAVPCLLAACSGRREVVVQTLAPPPVAAELLAPGPEPKCDLRPAEAYAPRALTARGDCWKAASGDVRQRHEALAAAVRVREAATAAASAAAQPAAR